jgi:hypothetical protein
MAVPHFQVVNVGTVANDGTGDPLRTAFIKVNQNFSQVDSLLPVDVNGNQIPVAPLANPHFTGDPTGPTAAQGDNDASLATTQFVQTAIATFSGTFTADPKVTTPADADNDTSVVNSAWVKRNFAHVDPANPPAAGVDLSAYAPLASPHFTGVPTAPTALPPTTSTIQLATTEFVQQAIGAIAPPNGGTDTIPPLVAKAIGAQAPEGRLTLLSNQPVMVGNVTGAVTIYYTPYIGAKIPLFDGTLFNSTRFDELASLLSDATHSPTNGISAGKLYDFFVWKDTGVTPNVLRLTHGPAWQDNTTRSAGTGIVRLDGIWLNSADIGTPTQGPRAQRGTYVGTVYCKVTNQLSWEYGDVGDPGRFLVWNAYNRVQVGTTVIPATTTWLGVGDAFWYPLDQDNTNRVEAVSGLTEDSIDTYLMVVMSADSSSATWVGIGMDWVADPGADTPTLPGGGLNPPNPPTTYVGFSGSSVSGVSYNVSIPPAGFHYWQMLESSLGSGAYYYGFTEDIANQEASGMTFNARM